MSLAMVGNAASYEFRWRRWALLRDTVAVHLEGAVAGSRYPHLASIGGALGGGNLKIPAHALAAELRVIRDELASRPIDDLALTPITASVLYPTLALDAPRALTKSELAHIAPIGDDTTLGQYFASMFDSMLEVAGKPAQDGTIEVFDG